MTQLTFKTMETEAEAQQCARMMANSEPWLTLGRDYARSLALVLKPDREVTLACIDGVVAGFTIINMQGAFTGYLQTICVDPARRGQGIGTALIAEAEARIFRDAPNVFLCVSDFNTGAQKLYKALGYEVVGPLPDYIQAGHSEILMRKTIGSLDDFRRGQSAGT